MSEAFADASVTTVVNEILRRAINQNFPEAHPQPLRNSDHGGCAYRRRRRVVHSVQKWESS